MTIIVQDIYRIAHLARLHISNEKIPEYVQNLNKLLDFSEQITGINTDHIDPLVHSVGEYFQPLREDIVTEKDQRAHFQKIAPDIIEDLYILPKVKE